MASHDLAKYSILCYSLRHLKQTDKVKFFYALKGRGKSPGIIKKYNITQLAKGALLVPQNQVANTKQFLTFWKCKMTEQEVYLNNSTLTKQEVDHKNGTQTKQKLYLNNGSQTKSR